MEAGLSGTMNANSSLEDSLKDFQTVDQRQSLSTELLNSQFADPLYQDCTGLIPGGDQLPDVLRQSLLDDSAMNSDAFETSANSPPSNHHRPSESPMNQTATLQQLLNPNQSDHGSDRQSRLQTTGDSFSSPRATSTSPPNRQTPSTLGAEAIVYNEQTQEYTMYDPIRGTRPFKINYQNIVNEAGRSYYKVVREDLIPIVNQSDLPSFNFQSEQAGKENRPSVSNLLGQQVPNSATLDWTANSPLSQLLLANQDNLCGLQSKEAAANFIPEVPDKQAKSPDPIDNSILTGFGNQAFQMFLARQLSIFSAGLNVTGGQAEPEQPHPIGSTPVKASKKTKKSKKSSKDAPVELQNENSISKCPYCTKVCGNKGGLASHIKRHKQDLPFACTVCPARFLQKGSLNKHVRTHKDKFPYTCSNCSKGFNDEKSLQIHMGADHGDPKPFACDQCEKSYAHQRSLKKHQKSHQKARQKSRKGSDGEKGAKKPAMEVEEPAVSGNDLDKGEEAVCDLPSTIDSSGVRFSSMLSDAELDLNVVFQQPDTD